MPLSEGFDKHKAIEFFKTAYKSKHLAPSYLFIGEAEDDKRDTAVKLAQIINCDKSLSGECNCSICKKIESLHHPDIYWLNPDQKSGSIKITQIRDIRRKIKLKPYELKKKVFVINEASGMTEEAQNALLKTLEEPPSDSVIILLSLNIHGLLDTIISRCKILKFKEKKDLDDQLKRNEIVDRFLSLDKDKLDEFFNAESRKELLDIYEALLSIYRDILVLKSAGNEIFLINKDKRKELTSLLDSYTYDDLYQAIDFLNKMHENINLKLNLKNCKINTIIGLKQFVKA